VSTICLCKSLLTCLRKPDEDLLSSAFLFPSSSQKLYIVYKSTRLGSFSFYSILSPLVPGSPLPSTFLSYSMSILPHRLSILTLPHSVSPLPPPPSIYLSIEIHFLFFEVEVVSLSVPVSYLLDAIPHTNFQSSTTNVT